MNVFLSKSRKLHVRSAVSKTEKKMKQQIGRLVLPLYASALTFEVLHETFVEWGIVPTVHSPLALEFKETATYTVPTKQALEHHMDKRMATHQMERRLANPLHRIDEEVTKEWSDDNEQLVIKVKMHGRNRLLLSSAQ